MDNRTSYKSCPHCKEKVFADMDICHVCGYSFEKEREEVDHRVSAESSELVPLEVYRPDLYELKDLGEGSMRAVGRKIQKRYFKINLGCAVVRLPISTKGIEVGTSAQCAIKLIDSRLPQKCVSILREGTRVVVRNLSQRTVMRLDGQEMQDGISCEEDTTFYVGDHECQICFR